MPLAIHVTAALAAAMTALTFPAQARMYLVYVGTYTGPQSKGIYAARLDTATGELKTLGLAAEAENPSFLAVDPQGRFLYAVNELSNYKGQKSGAVSAFTIDRNSGKLRFLNQVSSRGAGPCYVTLDRTGRYILVANYDGGSVAVFPVLEDGRLGEASAFVQHTGHSVNAERQEGPHAHAIVPSPDNRFVIAADLGLDELLVYRWNPARGSLQPSDPPFARVEPGAGPRHLAFHPNGKFVYVVNEMQSSVTAFAYDAARGELRRLETISALPSGFEGRKEAAEIAVHPSGRFLYTSNRGHDSIAVFAIDPARGTLRPIGYTPTQGRTPRYFAIDPTGSYLLAANQDSNRIVVFRIDAQTGRLAATAHGMEVPSPVCLAFIPLD